MSHHKAAHRGKIRFSQALLATLLVVVVALIIILFSLSRGQKTSNSISVNRPNQGIPAGLVKAPTPYLRLPQGKQEFEIRTGPTNDPVGTHLVVDPLDAPKGTKQSLSINVESNQPTDSVSATMKMDSLSKEYQLKLIDGTNMKGTWGATWTVEDNHKTTYSVTFKINSGGKQVTYTYAFR